MKRLVLWGVVALLVFGCHKNTGVATVRSALVAMGPACLKPKVLHVTRVSKPLKIDGEWDEPEWPYAVRTGTFLDARCRPARPFAEAHFLYDRHFLYIGLHAGDLDIRAKPRAHDGPVFLDDAFQVRLMPKGARVAYEVDVNAAGVVSDAIVKGKNTIQLSWDSHARVGVDMDGTLNDETDYDEEWFIEMALPFDSIGFEPKKGNFIDIYIKRCDRPLHRPNPCAYMRTRIDFKP